MATTAMEKQASRESKRRRQDLGILYIDEAVVAVSKPPGVCAIPGRAGEPTVIPMLRAQMGWDENEPLRLVHRLDKETSGVMLLARSLESQRALVQAFSDRRVSKSYLALTIGAPEEDEGEISLRIGPWKGTPGLMRVVERGGREACTRWQVVRRFVGYTLLRCWPLTGRTHQIRVHLQAVGMPLAVDKHYGGGEELRLSRIKPDYRPSRRRPEKPLIDRLTLHAEALEFDHPFTGQLLRIECPLPKDYRATLNQLSKWASLSGEVGEL